MDAQSPIFCPNNGSLTKLLRIWPNKSNYIILKNQRLLLVNLTNLQDSHPAYSHNINTVCQGLGTMKITTWDTFKNNYIFADLLLQHGYT